MAWCPFLHVAVTVHIHFHEIKSFTKPSPHEPYQEEVCKVEHMYRHGYLLWSQPFKGWVQLSDIETRNCSLQQGESVTALAKSQMVKHKFSVLWERATRALNGMTS